MDINQLSLGQLFALTVGGSAVLFLFAGLPVMAGLAWLIDRKGWFQ